MRLTRNVPILQLKHRRAGVFISRFRRLVGFIRAQRIDLIHTHGNRMEHLYGTPLLR
jgi:hypothetical protein